MQDKTNLPAAFERFSEHWAPRIVANYNGNDIRIVKVDGEFVWHIHEDTDDFFLVLDGTLDIELRDRTVTLGPGELFVVPRGIEHRPVARHGEVKMLNIERAARTMSAKDRRSTRPFRPEGTVMETLSTNRAHGGTQGVYRHASSATATDMSFSVYVPPHAPGATLPVLWYLSGLTCTHANVTDKGEYRRACAEHGVIFVAPDTSPRGEGVPDDAAYDFGQGAGFYVDATEGRWAANFRMRTYIEEELPALIAAEFPADMDRQGITGHSMGGHGALTIALRNPARFRSVSAFAPIVAPALVPWGEKALGGYLGEDRATWAQYDACALIGGGARLDALLVDIGDADQFLTEQLRPELLEAACAAAGIPLTLRRQPGYDHSYYFISTFMADHIAWHAERLRA